MKNTDISYTKEKETISTILGNFAQVLNNGETKALADFFDRNAIFIPDGMKKIIDGNQLGKMSNGYLKRSDFKISYVIKDIIIENQFAFVEAFATTIENRISDLNPVQKRSIDFFVLKKEDENWKIYRYIFNNVRELELI
ncbi:nuclear transport factor 2 family protein [Flavobacterium pectinovorum]|uniref:nuclear transport factor 2 family protein n=1 Tax=Flavobacterium pectinovorum TaxID=29533 RepID=UPI00265DA70A|nr:nuclear transport factor 2 family protein [Flavobacterium pectinovorum]WKL49256.1 nuclear transport factor 2 family protein [Flavobacterium pectinovorum]